MVESQTRREDLVGGGQWIKRLGVWAGCRHPGVPVRRGHIYLHLPRFSLRAKWPARERRGALEWDELASIGLWPRRRGICTGPGPSRQSVCGGYFSAICNNADCTNTTAAFNIARWDSASTTWSPVGIGVRSIVHTLAIDPADHLYIGSDLYQICHLKL